ADQREVHAIDEFVSHEGCEGPGLELLEPEPGAFARKKILLEALEGGETRHAFRREPAQARLHLEIIKVILSIPDPRMQTAHVTQDSAGGCVHHDSGRVFAEEERGGLLQPWLL